MTISLSAFITTDQTEYIMGGRVRRYSQRSDPLSPSRCPFLCEYIKIIRSGVDGIVCEVFLDIIYIRFSVLTVHV